MAHVKELDARRRPPDSLRTIFKNYQKATLQDLNADSDLIDLLRPSSHTHLGLRHVRDITPQELNLAFSGFSSFLTHESRQELDQEAPSTVPVYEAASIPGLLIYPNLLSRETQMAMLDKLLHRDLVNPIHQSNLHPFYDLPYHASQSPSQDSEAHLSFFTLPPELTIPPKDPTIHKPMSIRSMLNSKLRWSTLGGQYDWTRKEYPKGAPPDFPPDLLQLLDALFPEMKAQAAILNIYSPGDTLAMHRDVSEECDRALVSISIGCEAIFMVANEDGSEVLPLRVRSGDAILMSGSSRFAWHGIPRVLRGTCPNWLSNWPGRLDLERGATGAWQDWMSNKRINLNVRQMME